MNTKIAIIVILATLLMAVIAFNDYKSDIAEVVNGQAVVCSVDSDCVTEQCCHPTSCVAKELAPNCTDRICTMNCAPDTMDCGQGYCSCIEGKCAAVYPQI